MFKLIEKSNLSPENFDECYEKCFGSERAEKILYDDPEYDRLLIEWVETVFHWSQYAGNSDKSKIASMVLLLAGRKFDEAILYLQRNIPSCEFTKDQVQTALELANQNYSDQKAFHRWEKMTKKLERYKKIQAITTRVCKHIEQKYATELSEERALKEQEDSSSYSDEASYTSEEDQ